MGGGSGRLSLLMKTLGFSNIKLFDNSQPHVDRARALGIDAFFCDFYDFIDNQKYDLIIANEISQFIPMIDIIHKAENLLTKRGIIIVNYINPLSLRQIFKLNKSPKLRKHQYFTPQEFRLLWTKAGFLLLHEKSYMWQIVSAHSNSKLVFLFALIEKIFFLSHNISRGPWIMVSLMNNK